MSDTETKLEGAKILILLLSMPFTVSLHGYVLTRLWTWFIVSPFGLRPLGIAEAIGLACIVRFLTHDSTITTKKFSAVEALTVSVCGALATWSFGWLIHKFI